MKARISTNKGAVTGVLIVCAIVVAIDQIAKWIVVANLAVGDAIVLIPNQLVLNHVANPGAAFSMGSGSTWVFTIFSTVMVGVIMYLARRPRNLAWVIALGLVGGGALGNLLDRLFREPGFGLGHVVDFIQVPWFAIFNGADIAISCGVVLFILLVLKGVPLGTKQAVDPVTTSAESDAASPQVSTTTKGPVSSPQSDHEERG